LDEALALLKQALDLALKHGEDAAASYVLFNLITYTSMRSLEEGRAYAARLVEHARQIGDPMFEARGLAQLWFVDWLRGEWETATKELQDALAIKERVELITTPLIEGWRSWFWLNKGDLDAAEKYANLALASNDPKITHVVITNLSAALLQLELGRESEAVTHLQLCVEAFKKSEFTTVPLLHIETLMHLGVLHATYERFDEAASAIEWARRLAETLKSNAGLAMASQAQAYLLLRRGDWKASEEAYLNCLGLWDKAGWPYYKAKALVAYSEAVSQTNPEESKKLLQEAAGIFRKLGARRDLEKAEAKLSSR
jgi:tetratricopeptide (TPR) repeat protein